MFNHTATFRRESDFPLTLRSVPKPDEWFDDNYMLTTAEKNRLQNDKGLAPVVYMQSNCNYVPSDRDAYVAELMKYIRIDSYGKCLNNIEMPDGNEGRDKHSTDQNYKLVAQYKFQLAFENSICPDYMTEKIFRPLKVGTVPVYYGSSKIHDFMPSDHAVILVKYFKGPKDLADYLIELNKDDDKYNEYLKHRVDNKITNLVQEEVISSIDKKISSYKSQQQFLHSNFFCYVCDQLHKRDLRLQAHLMDASVPLLPLHHANSSHMGCPIPKPFKPNGKLVNIDPERWKKESNALSKMVQSNETDTKHFDNYL